MSEFNYEVQGDPEAGVVSILCKTGPGLTDSEGKVIAEDLESRLFYAGNVIPGDEIASHIVAKYEAGDPYTLEVLKQVPAEKPKTAPAKQTKSATAKKETAKPASAEE